MTVSEAKEITGIENTYLRPLREESRRPLTLSDFDIDRDPDNFFNFSIDLEITSWFSDLSLMNAYFSRKPLSIRYITSERRTFLSLRITDFMVASKSSIGDVLHVINKINRTGDWTWLCNYSELDGKYTGRFSGRAATPDDVVEISARFSNERNAYEPIGSFLSVSHSAIHSLQRDCATAWDNLRDALKE